MRVHGVGVGVRVQDLGFRVYGGGGGGGRCGLFLPPGGLRPARSLLASRSLLPRLPGLRPPPPLGGLRLSPLGGLRLSPRGGPPSPLRGGLRLRRRGEESRLRGGERLRRRGGDLWHREVRIAQVLRLVWQSRWASRRLAGSPCVQLDRLGGRLAAACAGLGQRAGLEATIPAALASGRGAALASGRGAALASGRGAVTARRAALPPALATLVGTCAAPRARTAPHPEGVRCVGWLGA